MAFTFYIGRSGSGKSATIMEEITAELKKSPLKGPNIFVLVPEQMTFQTEYELAKRTGGFSRVKVVSFSSLAKSILQDEGDDYQEKLQKTGLHLILQHVIEQKKNELRVFRRASGLQGFIQEMAQIIAELRRQAIPADDIRPSVEFDHSPLGNKLHDIYTIYKQFELQFSGVYSDKEDSLIRAIAYINESHLIKNTSVYIDGFRDFNPLELRFLKALVQATNQTKLALTVASIPQANVEESHLFYLTSQTFINVVNMLKEIDCRFEERLFEPGIRFQTTGLSSLEEAQQEEDQQKRENDGSVQIKEAVNRRVEMETVARSIRTLAREKGYRYNEVAVLARDLSAYEDLLKRIFQSYDIPFFLDDTRSMMHHPVVECIRSSLEVIQQHYPYEALFRAFKTDLFFPLNADWHEYRERVDELENIVLANGITGGRWSNGERWSYSKWRHQIKDAEQTDEELEIEERVNDTKNTLVRPLNILGRQLKASKTVKDMCLALYDFLLELRVPEKLERLSMEASEAGHLMQSSEHDQVWDAFIELIDQLVLVAGEEKMTLAQFMKMIDTGMESMSFRLVPPALDQVTIGDMERSRLPAIKATFIIGCNEGLIPARPNERGILTDTDRSALNERGLILGPSATARLWYESFYLYMAQASASHLLIFTYALADEDGASLLPSALIRQVKEMLDPVETDLIEAEASGLDVDQQLPYIAHPQQTLMDLARQLQKWKQGDKIEEIWWSVYNWFVAREDYHPALSSVLKSLYETYEPLTLNQETTKGVFGEHLVASVSRMELFEQCAFRHYSQYGLRLKERDVYRFEAFDMGELFHAVLNEVSDQLKAARQTWKTIEESALKAMTIEAVKRLAPTIQRNILESSNHYRYISEKLEQITDQVTNALHKQAKQSMFETIDLEVDFGPQTEIPSPVYQLGNGMTMSLRGRIDRVDQARLADGHILQVVDYKSSGRSLAFSDVIHGLSLQLPIYLQMVVNGSEAWLGEQSQMGGMFYFHLHNPVMDGDVNMDSQELDELLLNQFKLSGWLADDGDVASLMDQSLIERKKSNIIPVELKKDGQISARSKVLNQEQLSTLPQFLEKKVTQIGRSIAGGTTAVHPYSKENGQTACTYCPYQSVCQFDPTLPGYDYKQLKKRTDKEALVYMNEVVMGAEVKEDE
ncbi:ATP-dependent helicase/nuclease subunit B [Alkalihalobacillus xiaoxiensis]|uniref:ATP-dependent helicase/nuclease subunit B n=1 Tax=Shouchella xiaoxiensis TaxID=766895 RepID=A0ABS2SUF8_9BACI|nr:helicase-exonuclease AddAB subunit AddB [Shouchella xiaoxiensis]MBM7839137.1 ATP-dependent helicase/nuclease subunit B [Shouchella xiaoxiensis]